MLSDISGTRRKAQKAAQSFLGVQGPLDELGWGVSGFVFAEPGGQGAIKVHHTDEAYRTEIRVYKLLERRAITELCGLTIPHLKGYSDSRHLIHIDVVSPPFLLDFAGVRFSNPGFSADTMSDIHTMIRSRFGRNAHLAYCVYGSFLKYGVYYLDLRQSNLNIEGHPDLDSGPELEDETY